MTWSRRGALIGAVLVAALVGAGLLFAPRDRTAAMPVAKPEGKPALSVALTTPRNAELPRVIVANGNVAAWQEVIIGVETGGFRLTEVRVNVGDSVRKGDVLAQVSAEVPTAEVAQTRAAVAEARAALAEAAANAERARRVINSGVMSAQLIEQYLTAEQAAIARLAAAQARADADASRLARTRIVAPDDGIVSARLATVGAMAQPGQELFRLIRGSRLEWRAEVTAAELGRIRPGMRATLASAGGGGERVLATVRKIAPTVDAQTRNGIVYADLPADVMAKSDLRAGMFIRGEFELGKDTALTVPQSAVVQRDGFSYVFRVDPGNKVAQQKVAVGRRLGDRLEITGGLDPATRIVESGAGFLADGDTVKVIDAAPAPAPR